MSLTGYFMQVTAAKFAFRPARTCNKNTGDKSTRAHEEKEAR